MFLKKTHARVKRVCFYSFLRCVLWLNDNFLQQKCLKGQIRTIPARNTLHGANFCSTIPESHSAQRHEQTDRQTERRQDYANSRSYCVAVRSAKNDSRLRPNRQWREVQYRGNADECCRCYGAEELYCPVSVGSCHYSPVYAAHNASLYQPYQGWTSKNLGFEVLKNLRKTYNLSTEYWRLKLINIARNATNWPTNLIKWIFTARCYAERGYAIVCPLSVCPSVTFTYREHIGWKWEYFENISTAY